jgi:hypothetical protein
VVSTSHILMTRPELDGQTGKEVNEPVHLIAAGDRATRAVVNAAALLLLASLGRARGPEVADGGLNAGV